MKEYKGAKIRFCEVANGIYAALTPCEPMDITDAGMMNNFSNSAYIARGDGLVSDTFFDLTHAKELRDFCIKTGGKSPKYVINTHGHWDHFWGNQVFEGATVVGNKDMLKDCKGDKMKVPVFSLLHYSRLVGKAVSGILNLAFGKYLPDGTKAKFLVEKDGRDFSLKGVSPRTPDMLLEGNTTLDLDGTEVQIIHLGAIHSSSDSIVWIPSEGVLFAGDIFADCSIPMSVEKGKKWIEAMDYILDELKPRIIIPGHGDVYTPERAESQRAYFKSLISQVEQYYRKGIKAEELIQNVDIDEYLISRPRLAPIMAINMMVSELKKAEDKK